MNGKLETMPTDPEVFHPSPEDAERLQAAGVVALEEARAAGTAQIVAVRVELKALDPFSAFENFCDYDRFFWVQPTKGIEVVAEGAVSRIETRGTDRIRAAEQQWEDEMSRVHCVDPQTRDALRWLGGFAYGAEHRATKEWSRFPPGHLFLPELLLWREETRAWAVVARRVEPDQQPAAVLSALQSAVSYARSYDVSRDSEVKPSDGPAREEPDSAEQGAEYCVQADRSHAVYREQVSRAVLAIGRGEFEKVVLARSLEVRHPGPLAPSGFLARLCDLYPSCTIVAVGRGGHTLVSASPEFLVSLQGDAVRSHALAGSARRGSSPEQDERIGRSLQESKKEQSEHAAVVRALRGALAEVCDSIEGPESPGLLKLEGIQHLSTPLAGRLGSASSVRGVLGLVELLHPTPAVSGCPGEPAVAWIRENEGLERGWYAGPVGWLAADGSGEFWLALRMALIRQEDDERTDSVTRARLFAGAGIVEGSLPESELAETRLKLRALLAPLTEI